MKEDIRSIIDQELDEKNQSSVEPNEQMKEEVDKLVEEQNNKMRELQEQYQKGIDAIKEKYHNGNISGEELLKMQEEAMKCVNKENYE